MAKNNLVLVGAGLFAAYWSTRNCCSFIQLLGIDRPIRGEEEQNHRRYPPSIGGGGGYHPGDPGGGGAHSDYQGVVR